MVRRFWGRAAGSLLPVLQQARHQFVVHPSVSDFSFSVHLFWRDVDTGNKASQSVECNWLQ